MDPFFPGVPSWQMNLPCQSASPPLTLESPVTACTHPQRPSLQSLLLHSCPYTLILVRWHHLMPTWDNCQFLPTCSTHKHCHTLIYKKWGKGQIPPWTVSFDVCVAMILPKEYKIQQKETKQLSQTLLKGIKEEGEKPIDMWKLQPLPRSLISARKSNLIDDYILWPNTYTWVIRDMDT